MNNLKDEVLAIELSNGSEPAFEALFDRYAKKIEYFFYRMLWGDREKAADFTQDLFLKLLEKIHLFKPEQGFKTWLFSIANNMCKNEYRKEEIKQKANGHFKIHHNGIDHNQGDLNADLNIFKNQLFECLNKLPHEKKSAFILKYMDDVPLKEISEILELPVGTIKSGLHYTSKKLAIELEPYKP